jgi:hypothetical protein
MKNEGLTLNALTLISIMTILELRYTNWPAPQEIEWMYSPLRGKLIPGQFGTAVANVNVCVECEWGSLAKCIGKGPANPQTKLDCINCFLWTRNIAVKAKHPAFIATLILSNPSCQNCGGNYAMKTLECLDQNCKMGKKDKCCKY